MQGMGRDKPSHDMKRIVNIPTIACISILLLPACSNEKIAEVETRGHKIEFSAGFLGTGDSRVSTDADFMAAFDPGDEIGIFAYKRTPEQASSIESNEPYASNVKAVLQEGQWVLETPLYYTNDGTVLDLYAYYPYTVGTDVTALEYYAALRMVDLLVASTLGVDRSSGQPVRLLFEHLLAMVHLTVSRDDITPEMNDTFQAYFHGIVGGTYNLATKALSVTSTGVAAMSLAGASDTGERAYRAWVPAQWLPESEKIFSFAQTTPGMKIGLTGEIPEPVELSAGKVSLHRQILMSDIPKDYRYKKFDPYPKYGIPVGMVIEVYNEGRNGKVISLKNLSGIWAAEYSDTKATDYNDGISNTMKIQALPGWESSNTAFAVCAELGEGWYLPAIDECYYYIIDECYYYIKTDMMRMNSYLMDIAGGEIIDMSKTYWTSTESDASSARKIYMPNGDSRPTAKNSNFKVRAFYMF